MVRTKRYFLWGACAICAVILPMAFHSSSSFASPQAKSFKTVKATVATESSVALKQNQTNPLNLAVTGPIEHYVWHHDGLRDEVWHSLKTGEWKIDKTLPNGLTSTGVYKDGYYYEVSYQNGVMKTAFRTQEPADYTGKGSAIDGWKQNMQGDQVEDSTLNGIAVQIIEKSTSVPGGQTVFRKTYVDSKYHLPLKVEISSDGVTKEAQSWSYDYMQENQIPADLFDVPVADYKTFATRKK